MDQFLFLFRGGHQQLSQLSPEEMQAHMEHWTAWMQSLRDKGNFLAGQPLETDGRVVAEAGKTITDGPFAEGKEIVGGYVLIQAADMEEATRLSTECPIFEADGLVEIRKILSMNL